MLIERLWVLEAPMELRGLPRWCAGKESACQCRRHKRHEFDTWIGKVPWSRKWQPTPLFLPGKFHGQKSLAGYRPQDHKESDNMLAWDNMHAWDMLAWDNMHAWEGGWGSRSS